LHETAVALTTVTIVAAIGALAGVLGLARLGEHPSFLAWQLWWISDLLGVLAVAPAIFTLWLERLRRTVVPHDGSRRELGLLIVTAVLVAALVFGNAAGAGVWRSPYALVPVFLWASLRFRTKVVAWLNLAIALVASLATRNGVGAFATEGDAQLMAAVPLQFVLIVMFASAILLAVAVQDRRIALVDARAADARRREAVRRLTRAEEEVRRRTAEDLHDGISQTLLGARFTLEATLREAQPQAWRSAVSHAVELITRAQDDTRELIRDMSPPGLQQFGLGPTLDQLGGELGRESSLSVSVQLRGDAERLEPTAAAVLFRWTRELLINVVKHAGASNASVWIDADATEISLRVEDDGRGFDARRWLDEPAVATSFGLRSVLDRVSALGGRIDVDSSPGGGCRVVLNVPRAAVASADVPAPPSSAPPSGIEARRA
jgi:signal transduction histidine kinase